MRSSPDLLRHAAVALLLVLPAGPGSRAAAAQQGGRDISQIPLDRFMGEIENSYRGTRALEADFAQTYSAGGRERTEAGHVAFARGGLMRWDYQRPEPKMFLADGKNVELYLPLEKQLEKSSVKASQDYRVPFRLLLSRLDLRKYFSMIKPVSGEKNELPGDRTILGIPKGGRNRPYDQVLMEFDPDLNIRRLVITYRDQSVMTFIFTHIRRNPQLGGATFRFSPPPGTEIISPPDQGED